MIWEVPGLTVGHWSDPVARTGCTVVLTDRPTVGSGEVRGGAPATREFALLDPLATVELVDAVVLSGGSAFGLAAVDGVMAHCEARGRGHPTPAGPVPIVVGMALYDLGVGDPSVRPGPVEGVLAAGRAAADERVLGAVGAGCGCTVGSWRGADAQLPGGLVGDVVRDGDLVVAVLAAVNAWGDVRAHGHDGEPWPTTGPGVAGLGADSAGGRTNTTIGVVATNAALDVTGAHHLARGAHDGLARAVTPPHARADGDAFVALATGEVAAPLDLVRAHVVEAVDRAVRSLGGPRPARPGGADGAG